MQAQSSRISKDQRLLIFANMLPNLLPPCRRCLPRLIQCGCKHNCTCEISIEIMDRYGEEICDHDWPKEEAIAYLGLIGDALARLDPFNFGTPPSPSTPILTISSDLRIAAMSARNSAGLSLYHPLDRSADSGREGELIHMAENGVKKRRGVGKVDESKHEARWAENYDRKAHRVGVH